MNRHFKVVAAVVVGAGLVGWTASHRAVVTWEYQEVYLPARESAMPKLNQYGAAGWELVNVAAGCQSDGTCMYWAYFKRPK